MAALTVAALIAASLLNRLRPPSAGYGMAPRRRTGAQVSFALLIMHVASITVTVVVREDPRALFAEGLSSQNRVQAAVVAIGAGWTFYLATARRIRAAELTAGPRLWISLLILLFGLSTVWSDQPALTAFRAVELAVVWALALHAFSDGRRVSWFKTYLVAGVAGVLASGISEDGFTQALMPGGTRSNSAALIAALLTLIAIDTWVRNGAKGRTVAAASASIWALAVFDSLATVGALAVALCAYVVTRQRSALVRTASAVVATLVVLSLAVGPGLGAGGALGTLGEAFDRSDRQVENWSGRLPLWDYILEETSSHPLGFGLGSDRTLGLGGVSAEIGWRARSTHSGYFGALFSAGVPGFVLIVTVAVALVRTLTFRAAASRDIGAATGALLIVNNVSIAAFGAIASQGWVAVMALVVAGPILLAPSVGDETARRGSTAELRHESGGRRSS